MSAIVLDVISVDGLGAFVLCTMLAAVAVALIAGSTPLPARQGSRDHRGGGDVVLGLRVPLAAAIVVVELIDQINFQVTGLRRVLLARPG